MPTELYGERPLLFDAVATRLQLENHCILVQSFIETRSKFVEHDHCSANDVARHLLVQHLAVNATELHGRSIPARMSCPDMAAGRIATREGNEPRMTRMARIRMSSSVPSVSSVVYHSNY